MASNYGTKSAIPLTRSLKKELSTENSGKILTKSDPPKPLENKGRSAVLKEMRLRNEMSREGKQSETNTQKVTIKSVIPKKASLLKQNQKARVSTIETLSKDMVSHLKAEKLHDEKSSAESVDNGGNVFSNPIDETISKQISGEKKATIPSLIVQPKRYVPYGGLMLIPTVKKKTAFFQPFKFQPSPAKLRRSQSEYDPDFERPKAENIQPQEKCISIIQKDKAGPIIRPTKSSILSKRKELSSEGENKYQKNFPVQSRNNLVRPKISKNVQNKQDKPIPSKPKYLRRSNTIIAMDSERPKVEKIRPQLKDQNIARNDKADQKMKPTKASTFSKKSTGIENTFQKVLPVRSNNPRVPPRRPKNVSVENKPTMPMNLKSKPLRRSNTIHALDTGPVLNKVFGIRKNEPVNSKRITEQEHFADKTPVTPENRQLSHLGYKDIEKSLTPKKEIPHTGLVFKIQATKKCKEKKLKTFT